MRKPRGLCHLYEYYGVTLTIIWPVAELFRPVKRISEPNHAISLIATRYTWLMVTGVFSARNVWPIYRRPLVGISIAALASVAREKNVSKSHSLPQIYACDPLLEGPCLSVEGRPSHFCHFHHLRPYILVPVCLGLQYLRGLPPFATGY